MIIWAVLTVTVLANAVGLAMAGANREMVAALRIKASAGQVALLGLFNIATGGLWVWYAVDVGDWRFGAIGVVPVVFTVIRSTAQSAEVRKVPSR